MSARILLVASNLAVPAMTAAAGGLVRGLASGAIVTTAEIKLKERSLNAVLASTALVSLGIPRIEFLDLDTRPAADLAGFDFIYLAGGNPFYLLARCRETGADAVLEEMAGRGCPIIGSSAGAVVLGRSVGLVRGFDPGMPDLGWKDDDALGLVPFSVLPHANRWKDRLADYPSRLARARALGEGDVIELNDGEAIRIEGVVPGEPVATLGAGTTPLSPGFRTTFIRS